MESDWVNVVFLASLAGLAVFLGVYLVLVREAWSRRNSAALISFAAGVMLGVGFLHVLPEALRLNGGAMPYLLITIVVFYFLEHYLHFHADREQLRHRTLNVPGSHCENCFNPHPFGWMAVFGMTLHSLFDGMTIGAGLEVNHELGLLSALAVMAHKVPAGIAIVSILLHYGFIRRRAVLLTSFVAVATLVGAVLTYALTAPFSQPLMGVCLALAAGSFIYIAASALIPESHQSPKGLKGGLAFCAGILVVVGAGWLLN
ncbi:MAG: ZIP family metal transporter [Desulfuromonadales bacterium]